MLSVDAVVVITFKTHVLLVCLEPSTAYLQVLKVKGAKFGGHSG